MRGEPDPFRLAPVQPAGRQDELGRSLRPDAAGEQHRAPRLRCRAERGEGEADASILGGDDDVAVQQQGCTEPDCDAVHAGEQRCAHRRQHLDEREERRPEVLLVAGGEGVEIDPARKRRACTLDQHRIHGRVGVERTERIGQCGVPLGGECIEPIGAVERDDADRPVDVNTEHAGTVPYGVVHELGVADLSLDHSRAADLWAASGAQWLTDHRVEVPGALVRRVLGLVRDLDAHGAGLAGIVPAEGLGLLAERSATMGLTASGRTSCGGATRLVRAADGWFALSLARDDDHACVPAWLGIDPLRDEDPWPTIERVAADRTAADLVAQATLLGLPCAAAGETAEGRAVIAERLGHRPGRPVGDITVVSLASLWAGPLCADVLARLGAHVVTVESTGRPDGARGAPAFFEALHGRSASVELDLASAEGRRSLLALLGTADVVIEGSRPRALEQMGIDAREVAGSGPGVWVSITGHGRSAGARDRVGFGDDCAVAGGLVGQGAAGPVFVADAVADPLAGLTAAHAALSLVTTGGRWLVDVALARVSRSVSGDWIPRTRDADRPVPRSDPGAPMPLGRDTDAVLRSLPT